MLEWIVTSSLLILLVAALRKLPIAPWQRYALWLVVLVRLLVPVQLLTIPAAAPVLPDVGDALEEAGLPAQTERIVALTAALDEAGGLNQAVLEGEPEEPA